MSNTTRVILDVVRAMPGSTTNEIEQLCPEVKAASVSAFLTQLYRKGEIVRTRSLGNGRPIFRWEINPDPKKTPPPFKIIPREPTAASSVVVPTNIGLQARLDAALLQIAELTGWREAAIARFPVLGVPPIVAQARAIVAQVFRDTRDETNAKATENGSKDQSPIMRATINALGGE